MSPAGAVGGAASALAAARYPMLVLALTGLAYRHLVLSYFWADDFYYLYLLGDGRTLELLFTAHGGHVQPFRNLLFALLHAAFGMQAEWVFAAILLTHVCNALLLFALLRNVTGSQAVAAVGASLWGIDPLNDGSLAWLSVYGHVLVGTLVLAVLVSVQQVATATPAARRPTPYVRWYLGLLLASLSFGTGVGIAVVFPLVLAIWLPGDTHRRVRRVFWSLPAATVALYALCQWLHTRVVGRPDNTVPFVIGLLASLWWNVAAMTVHLFLVSTAALLAGPFRPDTFPPAVTAAAGTGFAAGIALVARWGTPAAWRALCGSLLVSLGAYGIIALGRGPGAPIARLTTAAAAAVDRYHYVGSIGVAIALALVLDTLRRTVPLPRRAAAALLLAWSVLMVVGIRQHPPNLKRAVRCRGELTAWRATLTERARQAGAAGRLFVANQPAPSCFLPAHLFPGQAAAFVIYSPSQDLEGARVYFVEPATAAVAAARARPWSRTAGLLITAEERARMESGQGAPPP